MQKKDSFSGIRLCVSVMECNWFVRRDMNGYFSSGFPLFTAVHILSFLSAFVLLYLPRFTNTKIISIFAAKRYGIE